MFQAESCCRGYLCPLLSAPHYSPSSSEDSSASSNHWMNFWSCWKKSSIRTGLFEIQCDSCWWTGEKWWTTAATINFGKCSTALMCCTYPLVLAQLSALVGGGSLREPAQYHLLLQDLQLIHVHQDLDVKTFFSCVRVQPSWESADNWACTVVTPTLNIAAQWFSCSRKCSSKADRQSRWSCALFT